MENYLKKKIQKSCYSKQNSILKFSSIIFFHLYVKFYFFIQIISFTSPKPNLMRGTNYIKKQKKLVKRADGCGD